MEPGAPAEFKEADRCLRCFLTEVAAKKNRIWVVFFFGLILLCSLLFCSHHLSHKLDRRIVAGKRNRPTPSLPPPRLSVCSNSRDFWNIIYLLFRLSACSELSHYLCPLSRTRSTVTWRMGSLEHHDENEECSQFLHNINVVQKCVATVLDMMTCTNTN